VWPGVWRFDSLLLQIGVAEIAGFYLISNGHQKSSSNFFLDERSILSCWIQMVVLECSVRKLFYCQNSLASRKVVEKSCKYGVSFDFRKK
jgi:hypothetical protein